ncbi:MAG: nitroreductase family protein [Candidatus Hodarchaeales archaeon]|jgi:nitroreductase
MSGIIFLRTRNLAQIKDFYINEVGMGVWQDQGDCVILKKGNLLLGFCERDESETLGVITFFYPSQEEVDAMYNKFKDRASQEPAENAQYRIYNFYAKDPEDRTVEFQCFLHPLKPYLDGNTLLETRRSIREFQDTPVSREILSEIFETCRYSPTSRNSQAYYFMVVEKESDPETHDFLGSVRAPNSRPISRAPIAVAICADPSKTGAAVQDACIAAYHFLLAAHAHGLGTCWIGSMNREDVKQALGVPQDHYVATVAPLGYPMQQRGASKRRQADEFVKFFNES